MFGFMARERENVWSFSQTDVKLKPTDDSIYIHIYIFRCSLIFAVGLRHQFKRRRLSDC